MIKSITVVNVDNEIDTLNAVDILLLHAAMYNAIDTIFRYLS